MKKFQINLLFFICVFTNAFSMYRFKPLLIKHKIPICVSAFVSGVVLLDVKSHAKYSALYAALKTPGFISMIQKTPSVKKAVTQSLGYKSFTQFLHEYSSVRKLKQECARTLESAGIPLDLCPTEGYLLAMEPKENITQWFGLKYFYSDGSPTAGEEGGDDYAVAKLLGYDWYGKYHQLTYWQKKAIRLKAYRSLRVRQKKLEEVLNKALIMEKEKWLAPQPLYSLYHGLSMRTFLYKYLHSQNEATRIPLLLIDQSRQIKDSYSKDGKEFLEYRPEQTRERFVTAVEPYGKRKVDMFGCTVDGNNYKGETDIRDNNDSDYVGWLVSANFAPMANAHTYGETCFRPFLENQGYTYRPDFTALKKVPDARIMNEIAESLTGVILQICIDKETAEKTTFVAGAWGHPMTTLSLDPSGNELFIKVRSKVNVAKTLEQMAKRPMSTYGTFVEKEERDRNFRQARVVVTKDYLLNEDWASNPARFQVVAHMDPKMQRLFKTLAQDDKGAQAAN